MGSIADDWFEPRRLFDGGYPAGLSSALRVLPQVRQAVRAAVASFGARSILEIGPGDAPVCKGLRRVVFMDVAPGFLAHLPGTRVVADLFAAPFEPGSFDLVVASDVLTHIRPSRRRAALACMAELGRDLLIFNPEPGTRQVPSSAVAGALVVAFFQESGFRVEERRFVAQASGGPYSMRLVAARRA